MPINLRSVLGLDIIHTQWCSHTVSKEKVQKYKNGQWKNFGSKIRYIGVIDLVLTEPLRSFCFVRCVSINQKQLLCIFMACHEKSLRLSAHLLHIICSSQLFTAVIQPNPNVTSSNFRGKLCVSLAKKWGLTRAQTKAEGRLPCLAVISALTYLTSDSQICPWIVRQK